jgi:hypothetical protein
LWSEIGGRMAFGMLRHGVLTPRAKSWLPLPTSPS